MSQDYSAHLVVLTRLVQALGAALRDKKLPEDDRIAADAMARLARLHGCIARMEKEWTSRN